MRCAIAILPLLLLLSGCGQEDDAPPPSYALTIVRTSPVGETRQAVAVPVGQSLTILADDLGPRCWVHWYFQPGIVVEGQTQYWATVRPTMDRLEVGILYSPLPEGAN